MGPSERLRDYCREVSGYIRWKGIRPAVEAEIEDHLQDQRDAYMAAGDDEETAAGRAIAQMGDPALVGRALDRTHRPRPQWFLAGLTGLLMLLGLAVNCFVLRPAPGLLVVPYFLPYALAFGVFLCFYFMDFSQLGRRGWTLYGLVLAFAALGILLGEWGPGSLLLTVGRLRIRLSYLALVFPAVYALAVYRMRSMGLPGILLSGAACLPPAVVLLLVSNLSGLILYAVAALGTLCLAIGRGWFGPNRRRQVLLISALLAGALLCLAVLGRRYLSGRLGILLHPEQDRLGAGYVYCMIRDILSESVWWGTGGVPEWGGGERGAAAQSPDGLRPGLPGPPFWLRGVAGHGGADGGLLRCGRPEGPGGAEHAGVPAGPGRGADPGGPGRVLSDLQPGLWIVRPPLSALHLRRAGRASPQRRADRPDALRVPDRGGVPGPPPPQRGGLRQA